MLHSRVKGTGWTGYRLLNTQHMVADDTFLLADGCMTTRTPRLHVDKSFASHGALLAPNAPSFDASLPSKTWLLRRMSVSLVKICRIDRYPQKQGSQAAWQPREPRGETWGRWAPAEQVDIRSGARKPTVGFPPNGAATGRDGTAEGESKTKKPKNSGKLG